MNAPSRPKPTWTTQGKCAPTWCSVAWNTSTFFRGTAPRRSVVKLVQTLALAKFAQGTIDNEVERRQLISNHPEKVVEALQGDPGQAIHLLPPREEAPSYFCVHHRGGGQVTCYLRYADSEDHVSPYCFVRWSDDYDAFLLSDDMMDLRLSVNDRAVLSDGVFRRLWRQARPAGSSQKREGPSGVFPVSEALYAGARTFLSSAGHGRGDSTGASGRRSDRVVSHLRIQSPARELSSHRRLQRFDQVPPMRGHLLLDGHPGGQINSVEIEADPAVVVTFA